MDSIKTMVFPVEVLHREFDGKLLLALTACERGWQVMLGNQRSINERVSSFPKCVYFSKSARSKNARLFQKLHRLGHEVVVLDEEALVRQTDDIYLLKHEKDALKFVNLLMTWGDNNKELWVGSKQFENKPILAMGNPRIDMLRPELKQFHMPEIRSIHARFGDYVLFNSNFATVNHFVAGRTRFNLASWVPADKKEKEKSALLSHKQALFESFRRLIPKLAAAIAPVRLVIRPHPSENHEPWIEAGKGSSNVSVVYENNVVPWLIGARVLIHNGCTSAVEAAVAGTSVISYRPVQSAVFDNALPNDLSIETFDENGLLHQVEKVLKGGSAKLTSRQFHLLNHHIASARDSLSCDRIIDAIEHYEIGLPGRNSGNPIFTAATRLLDQQSRIKWLMTLTPKGKARAAYRNHKFPGVTEDYVNDRIARFHTVLGRFKNYSARTTIAPNIYSLQHPSAVNVAISETARECST
jgi:surface carbohydrate biosynthesis protein